MERLLLLVAGISVLILKQLKFGQWKKIKELEAANDI